MRKTLLVLSAVAAAALATPASAQSTRHAYVAPVTGAVVGTAVGVGLTEGWFVSTGGYTAFPTAAAGAAATGLVAGVGAATLIHAATTPCQGFHMFFGNLFTRADGCVNGQWVGDAPRRVSRR